MITLEDHVWRSYEHRTIEAYMGPHFNLADPPSVAKELRADGIDPDDVHPDALVKTERYAATGALYITHANTLLTGDDYETRFTVPIAPSLDRKLPVLHRIPKFGESLRVTFKARARYLQHDSSSRYGPLLDICQEYIDLDEEASDETAKFIMEGGGLQDGMQSFLQKIILPINDYMDKNPDDDRLRIYHDTSVAALALATPHISKAAKAFIEWDGLNPDDIRITKRGKIYAAVNKDGATLFKPETKQDTLEVRPWLMCPAHANIRSLGGSALKRSFHAGLNEAHKLGII